MARNCYCKAKTVAKVVLREVLEGSSRVAVTVATEQDGLALILEPKGYGVYGVDGDCAPVLLEVCCGKLRLVVWADINDENPTHIIPLDGAKLSSRKVQPE